MNCSKCDRDLKVGKDACKPDGDGGVLCIPCYCKIMNFVEKREWRTIGEFQYEFTIYTDPDDKTVLYHAEAKDGIARVFHTEKITIGEEGKESTKNIERDILRKAMGHQQARDYISMLVGNLTTLDEIETFCERESGENFIKVFHDLQKMSPDKIPADDLQVFLKAYLYMYSNRELSPVLLSSGLDFESDGWKEVIQKIDECGGATRALLTILTNIPDETRAKIDMFLKVKAIVQPSIEEEFNATIELAKIEALKQEKLKLDLLGESAKVKIIKNLDEYRHYFVRNGMPDKQVFRFDILKPYIYIELSAELRYGFEGDNRIATVYAFGAHTLRCTFEDGDFKFAQYEQINESFKDIPEYVNADLLTKAFATGSKAWKKAIQES